MDDPQRWNIYMYSFLGVQLPFMELHRIKNKKMRIIENVLFLNVHTLVPFHYSCNIFMGRN